MKTKYLGTLNAGLCVAIWGAAFLPAVSWAALPGLNGRWRAAETAQETSERKKAIERTVSELPSFFQGRAKSRLKKRTSPVEGFSIVIKDKTVRLEKKKGTLELELGGVPKVIKENGERGKISAQEANGKLVVKMEGEEGTRVTTYSVTKAGQLKLSVRLQGERLKKPLVYEQTYVRVGP